MNMKKIVLIATALCIALSIPAAERSAAPQMTKQNQDQNQPQDQEQVEAQKNGQKEKKWNAFLAKREIGEVEVDDRFTYEVFTFKDQDGGIHYYLGLDTMTLRRVFVLLGHSGKEAVETMSGIVNLFNEDFGTYKTLEGQLGFDTPEEAMASTVRVYLDKKPLALKPNLAFVYGPASLQYVSELTKINAKALLKMLSVYVKRHPDA